MSQTEHFNIPRAADSSSHKPKAGLRSSKCQKPQYKGHLRGVSGNLVKENTLKAAIAHNEAIKGTNHQRKLTESRAAAKNVRKKRGEASIAYKIAKKTAQICSQVLSHQMLERPILCQEEKKVESEDKKQAQDIIMRRIDKYTTRSKQMQKQGEGMLSWIKNVSSQLQLNRDALKKINQGRYKRQLSQRAIHQRSISEAKPDPTQFMTNDDTRKISEESKITPKPPAGDPPNKKNRRSNSNESTQAVSTYGGRSYRKKAEPPKQQVHEDHKNPENKTRQKIKFDLIGTPRRVLVKDTPRGNIIHLTEDRAGRHKASGNRKNSIGLKPNLKKELENLQVQTMDNNNNHQKTLIELPEDPNFDRMVSFMEGLKKYVGTAKPPAHHKKPKVVVQNYLLDKSCSVRNLRRPPTMPDLERNRRHKVKEQLEGNSGNTLNRCETPNTIPSSGITQNHSGTPGNHKRSLSFTKIRTRLGSIILNQASQRSIGGLEVGARKVADDNIQDLSKAFMVGERYKIIMTPKHKQPKINIKDTHTNVKPKKPMGTRDRVELWQKFRHARKLFSNGHEVNATCSNTCNPQEVVNFTKVSKEEIFPEYATGDETNLVEKLRTLFHIQPGEELVLRPILKASTPDFPLTFSAKDVLYYDSLAIPFDVHKID